MYNALYEMYYRIEPQDIYQVQMQLQTKAIGVMFTQSSWHKENSGH